MKQERSITNALFYMSGKKPVIHDMRCCGSFAWRTAFALGCTEAVMLGMDFGYPGTNKIEKTPNYAGFLDLVKGDKEKVGQFFCKVYNPFFNNHAITDVTFMERLRSFMHWAKLVKENGGRTVNCTGADVLYDKENKVVESMKLKDYLEAMK